jgi:glycine hydroxymethyltransferase
VPFDTEKPAYASGIRIGTPAMTTKGYKEAEMKLIAKLIDETFENKGNNEKRIEIKNSVIELTKKFPFNKKEK